LDDELAAEGTEPADDDAEAGTEEIEKEELPDPDESLLEKQNQT